MSRIETIAEGVTLYLGDCREILPGIDPVDVLATDPPYVGLTGGAVLPQGGVGSRRRDSITLGDVWGADLDWVPLAMAVTRRAALIFCGFQSAAETRQAFAGAKAIALITWYKRNTPAALKGVPRHTAEHIWAFSLNSGLINWSAINSTVIDIPNLNAGCVSTGERLTNPDGSVLHPSQKPLDLMMWLLGIGGGSVLDPFMGTGTTGVAAVKRGQQFAGIERDPKYFDVACRRIAEATKQQDLFIEKPRPAVQLGLLDAAE